MQQRAMVVGNWKMNGTVAFAQDLTSAVCAGVAERVHRHALPCEVVLCPPFTSLLAARQCLAESTVRLGGQNMSAQTGGPFTGEIAGSMLRDLGCSHVILGHSERRSLMGEGDAQVASKMAAAFRDSLTPIVCLGETLAERMADRTLEVIHAQTMALLTALPADEEQRSRWVLAYEPVWAIGTGRHASPAQIQAVHGYIRQLLSDQVGATIAPRIPILYGGSVTPDNAPAIFAQSDVDGGLIGGASLKADTFLAIVDACLNTF
ncbi:MAG: triose-phosphate isomerase [Magnetococcus sp. DMHC-8]